MRVASPVCRTKNARRAWPLGVAVAAALVSCAGERGIAPDLAKIHDANAWRVVNGEPTAATDGDRSVLRLHPIGGDGPGSNVGMALVNGVEFAEGTIDVDLKGEGPPQRSFLGVAFGVVDTKTFEAVYFRPFNFRPDDPAHRSRAVQYIAWPEHTWEELRARTPGVYESTVDPVPDPAGWFHVHVEVAKRDVRVFVDGAKKPCLVVERLRSPAKGGVALWVDSHEGAFANLRIVATP